MLTPFAPPLGLGMTLWLVGSFLIIVPIVWLMDWTWRRIADPLTAGPGRNALAGLAVALECFALGGAFHFGALAALARLGWLR